MQAHDYPTPLDFHPVKNAIHFCSPHAPSNAVAARRRPASLDPKSYQLRTGKRELLRAQRAAEMAVWEATPPSTAISQARPRRQHIERLPGLPMPRSHVMSGEAVRFLIITLCAVVSLIVAMTDMFNFLAGWSSFIEGIQRLLG